MRKRILCALLAAVLLLSLLPGVVLPASAVAKMKTSEPCIEILKAMEGFVEKPFLDNGQYTVGYGSACGKNDYPNGITEAQADALLRKYLADFEATVNNFMVKYNIILSQNQFDALMLFTYNVGGNWVLSDGLFRQAVISGKTGNDFIYAMTLWSNASAKLHMGLVERRLIEADLYLNGSYDNKKPSNYTYVLLDSNEGVSDAKVQGYDCNLSAAILAEPEKTGSTFLGWYTAKDGGVWVTELSAANAEQTLYAHWQAGAGDPAKGTPASYQIPAAELEDLTSYDAPGGKSEGKLNQSAVLTINADYVDAKGVKWGRLVSGSWVKLGNPRTGYNQTEQEEEGVEVTVTGDYVNVRNGPGMEYKVVGGVSKGDKLLITRTYQTSTTTWGKFRAGWISLTFTNYKGGITPGGSKPAAPESETPIATGTVVVNQLNIRANPGTNGYLAGCYTRGTKVNIFEKAMVGNVAWGRTEKGWICLDYVKLDGQEAPTTTPTTAPTTAPTTGPTEAPSKPTEPETTNGIYGTVTSRSGLNIRKGAGTNHASVGSYASGERILILEQKLHGGVIWGRTNKGWVSMAYVKLDTYTNGTIPSGVKGTVTASGLMIRKGPGTGYAVQGSYSRGKVIQILEMTRTGATNWGRTELGWVCMDYVDLNQTTQTPAPPAQTEPPATTNPPAATNPPAETKPSEDPKPPVAGTTTGTVTAGGLNIRAAASTASAVVGSYGRGDKVTILEQKLSGGVVWGRTDKGWISLAYVKLDTTASGTTVAGYSCTVTATSLCIRKGPGTAYASEGTYKRGQVVTILETIQTGATKWGRTDKGWICMDYVKMESPTQPEQNIEAGDIGMITATELCIRKAPGTGNAAVGTYKYGESVVILEIRKADNTNWGRTDKGWICMDYVRFVATPNADADKETEAAPDAGTDSTDKAPTEKPDTDEDNKETVAPEESEPVAVFDFTGADYVSKLNAKLAANDAVAKAVESKMENTLYYEFVALSDGESYGVAMFIELAEDGKKVAGVSMACDAASETAHDNLAALAEIAMTLVDPTITEADLEKMMSEFAVDDEGNRHFIMERASGVFAFEAASDLIYFYMYPIAK